MDLGKTKLTRKPGESGRDLLTRRLQELDTLKKTLDRDDLTEDEQNTLGYCRMMIPEIKADLENLSDGELEKQVNWELSGEHKNCPTNVDHLPIDGEPAPKTRAERGLETLPCIYVDCPKHGSNQCWAWLTDKEPVTYDYGMYPNE